MMGLPTATLGIERQMSNPPKPIGCGVFIDGIMIAVIGIDEVKRAAEQIKELEDDYGASLHRA
jgi:hypothetical protein